MEYRKERNFMVAYDDEGNMRGKWDILTNTFIGIKGNPVKTIPAAFSLSKPYMPTYLFAAVQFVQVWFEKNNNYGREYSSLIANRLEQVISLQLQVENAYRTIFFLQTDTTPLTKDLVTFLKEENFGIYGEEALKRYKFVRKHKDFITKIEAPYRRWATDVLQCVADEIPVDFIHGMILRGINEKVFYENRGYSFGDLINKWYFHSKKLGYEPEVKHNILTNAVIIEYLYEEDKTKHCDERLKKFNDKPWLYYENDDYIVRPLLSKEEFHTEAEYQHNCVERAYMERVVDEETHVVSIRKKVNPDVPYITCEVTNSGNIRQYLLKYNYHPTSSDDKAFYSEYQNHLLSSLNE